MDAAAYSFSPFFVFPTKIEFVIEGHKRLIGKSRPRTFQTKRPSKEV